MIKLFEIKEKIWIKTIFLYLFYFIYFIVFNLIKTDCFNAEVIGSISTTFGAEARESAAKSMVNKTLLISKKKKKKKTTTKKKKKCVRKTQINYGIRSKECHDKLF